MVKITEDAEKYYKELYPETLSGGCLIKPLEGYTLDEVRTRPIFSDVTPGEVDLRTSIGPVQLNKPFISAAMDTVSGPAMGKAMFEIGGCGILDRCNNWEENQRWIFEVLEHIPCLVAKPLNLHPDRTVEKAQGIIDEHGFSTIPVVGDDNVLHGILFTGGLMFKSHLNEPVKKWMKPFAELQTVRVGTSFEEIHNIMANKRKDDAVLPVVDDWQRFHGMYFMKDFLNAQPSFFNGKPLVGIAVGVDQEDLERARFAFEAGVGMIVVDSSHGNCPAVINQAKAIVEMAKGKVAVIAGNVADIDGYVRLADVGVDGVKCGIGSGAICTTTQVTGAGFPMFTLIRELAFAKAMRTKENKHAPVIIPDGGINGPGNFAVAIVAGGQLCMAGEWLVAAQESHAFQTNEIIKTGNQIYILYRGMASKEAIEKRLTYRYGKGKRAPEGISGYVPYRGPLKKWIGKDLELVKGGLAHSGISNLGEAHEFGNWPFAFARFTGAGQNQINTRVQTDLN